jgi:tetratricopeptide (TPR) repeat protein
MTRSLYRLCRHIAAILAIAASAPALAVGEADVDVRSLAGAYLAARTADVDKDVDEASAFYRAALRRDPGNQFLIERAMVLSAAAGDPALAVDYASQLMEISPANGVARLILAVEHVRSGEYAAAVERVGDESAGVLADLTNALVVAWARVGMGEAETAVADLKALEGEQWYEPFKLLHLGYIEVAGGDIDAGVAALEAARALDGSAVRIIDAYARALARAGRANEGIAALEQYLASDPANPLAAAALADIRAGGDVPIVSTPAEGVAEALAGIGAAIGQEGGAEVAFLYLRLALYLDPEIAGGLAALSLGNLFAASDQGETALDAYALVEPDAPFRALASMRAALALNLLDRVDESEAAFREALARDPDDVDNIITFGNVLRSRERFAESAEIYSLAIERLGPPEPAHWTLYYYRGIAYERTKQWALAEADLTRALELSPDQPLVLNYLGYSWVDMGINLDEGMEMIRRAVELRPNDGFIVDSLGWAHYRLGNYEQAAIELERAVALQPEDPTINDHLGDAYWMVGRTLEAQFQWRHARDFGAESPQLDLILQKIAERRLVDAPQPHEINYYTVQPGDSLWTISASLLDSPGDYQRLFEDNRDLLADPNRIQPGMRLVVPGRR